MSLDSVLSIFKVGIGPSSSHTFGTLKSALRFRELLSKMELKTEYRVQVELMGSLALTGKGHLSDLAVIAGLGGYDLEKERSTLEEAVDRIIENRFIKVNGIKLHFNADLDIRFNTSTNKLKHPNTLRYYLLDKEGREIVMKEYRSIGGGMITGANAKPALKNKRNIVINNMTEATRYCRNRNIGFTDLVFRLEKDNFSISEEELLHRLTYKWEIMSNTIETGLKRKGVLPGRLKLKRKAFSMYQDYLKKMREWRLLSPEITLTCIYGIAVAEENAGGGVIVTAPTCGSAGIVPAVLKILKERYHLEDRKIAKALLVSGLIGAILVKNASISGAEVGCQGEVGTAASMAAAAAAYLLGGTIDQIESAAEIALEHYLGLTCDPVDGLVQIPCIERNGVGAVTALNAANLALLTKGKQQIRFDNVVRAMKEVGKDMHFKYKETSLGGLAKICRC